MIIECTMSTRKVLSFSLHGTWKTRGKPRSAGKSAEKWMVATK